MSLSLGTVITAARDRSAWFHRSRVPDAVAARFLSDFQNTLIGAAARRDPQYLAQVATVVLHLDGADAPGVVGAGTSGGAPGATDDNGMFSSVAGTAGALIETRTASADGAQVVVAERVVTSATQTSLTSTGAARPTNQDIGRVLVIATGTGIGQRRSILSNAAESWIISTGTDGQQWTTVPDTTSVFDVVVPTYGSDSAATVFTAVPSTTSTTGYLVKLTSAGVPFIDFTQPLVATIEAGVSLPAMQFPLDGTVWCTDGSSGPLGIVAASDRFGGHRWPSVYVNGQQLYLAGSAQEWQSVASIALRYTPIAPAFTALTDAFLVPDHARPALVSATASFMAARVSGMEGVTIDPTSHRADALVDERSFLANVSAAKRGRGLRTREVW